LRIVFYTDVHARTEREAPGAVQKAAEMINDKKGDLVIGGGDLITDGLDAIPNEIADKIAPRWQVYMNMHKAIVGEHHTVIGNHDLVRALPKDGSPPLADPRSDYKNRLGLSRTFYTFETMGYRFILLDSMRITGDEYKYQGWVSQEQQEWIKEELSRISRSAPIVVVLHIPLLTAFYNATKGATFEAKPNRVVVNNVEVLKLFKHHNLVLVLQGHLHVSELLRWQNTTFITGGAVCGRWWRGPFHGTEEGFNVVTLHPDHVDWEYVDCGWEVRRSAKL
jgi:3',5'-cyclic AMP phosphodiesterase CpdA